MRRGEVWFAARPGGDRPVLVLTRDPVAERISRVGVAVLTRSVRGLVSELELTPEADVVSTRCVVTDEQDRLLARRARDERISKAEAIRRILNSALDAGDPEAEARTIIESTAGICAD